MRQSLGFLAVLILFTMPAAAASRVPVAQFDRKTKVIQCQVRTEHWSGWGDGEVAPTTLPLERPAEKFERFETPAGQPPTFSGKVLNLPPGKRAHVTVVANVGTQWINAKNYKAVRVESDGSFTITADHKPDADKSLAVNVDGRLSQFLRAEFAPTESARNIEFRLPDVRSIVLSMEDAQAKAVQNFRVEAFNAYTMHDDAAKALRIQRLTAGSTANGAIVFDAPASEPIAVLLSANGLAPYYQIIDPREATAFHFKMLSASRIRGVVTRNGQPVPNEQMYLVNRAAPLSATLRKTDAKGRFDIGGRVPGQQDIRIADYETSLQLQPGEAAEVTLELTAAEAAPTAAPTVSR